MLGKLIASAGLAVLLLVGPAAAAGGYGDRVSTSCDVSVTARAGKPISAYVDVSGNASNAIHGLVTVTVFTHSGPGGPTGTKVWSRSTHYAGSPLRFHGPVMRRGTYRAVATFDADPGVYLDCRCFGRFSTKDVAGEGSANGNSESFGSLPNTGGPSEWWLFVGFGLLAAGGSAVAAGRRHARVF